MREIKKVQFNEKGIEEKERKKEINRFRFLLIAAFLAFFVGIAGNFFYDLLIGTDLTLTKALSIGLMIVFSLSFLFLIIDGRMKALGFNPPAPSTFSKDVKEITKIIFGNIWYFIKFLTISIVIILFLHSPEIFDVFFLILYTLLLNFLIYSAAIGEWVFRLF